MLGFLKSFILLLAALYYGLVNAQNLIPNPGFEELFTVLEYQWVQPQGAYYHYESSDTTSDHPALGGQFVNGLCMYNTRPNEYLHVKLLEPLKKDVAYRLEVNARLMPAKSANASAQRYIGVSFGSKKLDTHIPGDLYLDPQVNLRLPEGDRFEWFQMTDTFVAAGGETYLTMGYFSKTQLFEEKEKVQEAFFENLERKYDTKQDSNKTQDLAWLYLSPEKQKAYLKEKKKQEKKAKNKKEDLVEIPEQTIAQEPEKPPLGYSDLSGAFAVRYYFDDLCLLETPVENPEKACQPENLPETIEVGKTINLRNVFFATDSATLKDESVIQLNALQKLMVQYPDMTIELRGYTDDVGDETYNLELSLARAQEVARWLSAHDVSLSRLSAKGFGESQPIESNGTEAGRARNRRVTFFIISM